jgi:alpha-mannosidase
MNTSGGFHKLSSIGIFLGCFLGLPAIYGQQALPQSSVAAPSWGSDAAGLRLHMIGNAHIDAVWLWTWPEGDAVTNSTFRSALDRLNDDPQITMTTSSSKFYEWVADNDPALLASIRKRVQEGRWDLVGGWWVEPDVNIPNGEALARQGLYGQLTLQRLFGKMAKTGYNPDSFGHPGSLPQILKLQSLDNYVFMRPNATEKNLERNLFWWEGVDGTRVLTFRIPLAYDDPADVRGHMEKEIGLLKGQPIRDAMEFFGIGDHGGGPTKANMASIRQIQQEKGAPTIFYSTPDRYFDEIRKASDQLTTVQDDFQHHSVGCYTAVSAIKKGNRMAEAALQTAEKFAAVGSVAWGANYPKADFTEAWKKVLFLQFHDSLAGTALPEHYVMARDAHGRAMDTAHDAMFTALQKLAWQIPTVDPDSKYYVVFNPHAWPVKENVEYDFGWDRATPGYVLDEMGRVLPSQWIDATTVTMNRLGFATQVDVPAFGYRQIRILKGAAPQPLPQTTLQVSDRVIENQLLKVTFSSSGTVGILDKRTGKQVFQGGETGARAVVLDDPSDTWSHHVRAYDKEIGSFGDAATKVIESGPLRGRVRVRSKYGNSTLTTDWILYAGGSNVEMRVSLDWHEHQKILKFSFPVDLESPQATYEIPYGAMERSNVGEEDPGQRWIDVTGTSAGRPAGFAIVNDAKYGYSINRTDMRVSVVRGAVYAQHEPRALDANSDYQWMDQGVQEFRMLLMPHAGGWQDSGVVHAAEELVASAPVMYQGIHPGDRPESASFLSVDSANVVVTAVKEAEDGDDIIVRCFESTGRESKATVNLAFANTQWSGTFHPFEIKTLRITRKTHAVREVNILEQ